MYVTTLRGTAACMVLAAPIGASYASGIMHYIIASERCHARSMVEPQVAVAIWCARQPIGQHDR